ncbi:MAG: T9SS type A sorting domain-containing protein, partial [Candidatus Latescibacteria bacterium]|nr:T9SS type A sorting domain-containing protein [Candidatus Latescibacterota bacterium]
IIPEDAVITKVAGRYKITRALQVPGGSGRFTTAQAPDTQAPVILSGPTITGQTAASVTIQWTTDELSTSIVDYGTGGVTNQRQEDGTLVTTHALTLTNLSAATVYSYLVSSTDPSNNGPSQSAQAVVQTAAQADVTPPTISGVGATSSYISVSDGTTGTITWTTNEPANSVVEFGTTSALGQTKSVSEAVASHTVTITRMTPGSTYFYRVQSTDQSGNGPTQSSIASFAAANTADTTPPVLTAVSTTGTTHNLVSVSWTTDEPATSILRVFQTGTTDTVTVGSGALVTSHTLSVTDTTKIRPSTGYTLIVESADARNNVGASSTTVTTAAGADVTPPSAPATVTATPGSEQVLVTWSAVADADLAGYDVFQNSIQVVSGLTTTTYTATGLTNGTAYTYQIKAADLAGNRSSLSPSASATPSAAQAPTKPTPIGTYVNTPPGAGTQVDIVSLQPILVIGNATPVAGRPRPTYTFAVYGDSLLTTLIISVSGIVQSDSAGNPTHWQVVNPALPGGIALLDSTRYYWRSRANDTVTDGAWSDKATFFTSSAKPVGVELASFTAADDRGVVTVQWRTFASAGIAGFHVYRSLNAQGTFDRLTASLLTGRQGQYEYRDQTVGVNATYYYQLEAVSPNGTRERFGPIAVRVTPPAAYRLSQNAPNPFNPTTTIRYELPRPGQVRLTVYNLLGQEVVTLVDAQQEAGFHTVQWTGLNAARQRVASGVYFYRLTVQGAARTAFTSVKKMLLLK